MASLKDAARSVLETAKDGIAYLVAWKEGRGWHIESYYEIDCNEYDGWRVEGAVLEKLRQIVAADPNAIAVNGNYDNLGGLEDMTLSSLMDGIRFQYEVDPGSLAYALSQVAIKGDMTMIDTSTVAWKDDRITRKYVAEHREQLERPGAMKPRDLGCACTYCVEWDNPYSREIMRRSGHIEKYQQEPDTKERRKIFESACRYHGMMVY